MAACKTTLQADLKIDLSGKGLTRRIIIGDKGSLVVVFPLQSNLITFPW